MNGLPVVTPYYFSPAVPVKSKTFWETWLKSELQDGREAPLHCSHVEKIPNGGHSKDDWSPQRDRAAPGLPVFFLFTRVKDVNALDNPCREIMHSECALVKTLQQKQPITLVLQEPCWIYNDPPPGAPISVDKDTFSQTGQGCRYIVTRTFTLYSTWVREKGSLGPSFTTTEWQPLPSLRMQAW